MEFLAKHADHAGLWLLGPALVAGLAVPNIKLQSMLAAAMAIELRGFFACTGRVVGDNFIL